MPRPGARHSFVFFRVPRAHGQQFFPILPVAICERHRYRRADRLAMAHARKHMGRILLDAHATAAAIPLLPAPQLTIQKRLIERNTGRQAADERHQRFAMAFAGSRKPQHSPPSYQGLGAAIGTAARF